MSSFLRRHQLVACAATAAILALILYWPTLTLPIIYDDLLHIRITKGLNLATVWLPTEAFGFYRPLTFLPLLIIKAIFGYYPNWLLHGLNVAQHALNAALLAALSWRLWRDWRRALVAGLLFALFPFSYQAVAVYGHNVHPTTAGLILAGLHTYLTAISDQYSVISDQYSVISDQYSVISGRRLFWWLLTGFIFWLGLLSHESAILFGTFAALIHWNHNGRLPHFILHPFDWLRAGTSSFILHPSSFILRRPPPWLIFLLLGALYLVGYQFLPISRAPQATDVTGGSVWLRALYLLQAAAYPLTWLAHKLPQVGVNTLVLGSTAVTLGITVWAARRRANRLPLLLGWGWWGIASLLIAIPLSTNYLLHGPRLLYLGSIGLAIAWATIVTNGAQPAASSQGKSPTTNPSTGSGQVLQSFGTLRTGSLILRLRSGQVSNLFLAFILITNWLFVRGRLADYAQLTNPVAVMADVMGQQPDNTGDSEGVVLVNLPQWLAPPRNTYAVGAEFVAMLGDYLFADELVAENLPGQHPVYPVVIQDLLDNTAYNYGIHDETRFRGDAAATIPIPTDWAAAGSQVFVVYYTEAGLQTRHTGGFNQAIATQTPLAHLGPYELLTASGAFCQGDAQVTLVWRRPLSEGDAEETAAPIPPTVSIFVQLLAGDGRLIAQADGPPLGLRPDFIQFTPGWEMTDRRTLPLAETEQPAQILVGVYDYASGERFPAYNAQREPLPDNAFRVPLLPCP